MCGITGAIAFTEEGKKYLDRIGDAVKSLRHRGPDGEGIFRDGNVALGHTRLAIIDTSDLAAQPFTSNDGRYTIVLNGEIFNYKELRAELEKEGVKFRSQSDTEVLLELFAKEKEKCLPKLNGFFAFAIYDKNDGSVFLARDRYGEKPLYIYESSDVFIFASEAKAVYASGITPEFDTDGLELYVHLNYSLRWKPVLKFVEQIEPGRYFHQSNRPFFFEDWPWYKMRSESQPVPSSYKSAKEKLVAVCEESVLRRLISDVPLGSFLSGGLDSSIITAIASKHKKDLETFSIGFADEPFFDETEYARLVSKSLGTKHHVFSLTNKDLLQSLHEFLENCDDPFADSSALALNVLAKRTKQHVTVALSGDGADELFAGYNKHEAELRIRTKSGLHSIAKRGSMIWNVLPASRNSKLGNRVRQLRKFAEGSKMTVEERYWRWAGYTSEAEVESLLRRKKTSTSRDTDLLFGEYSDDTINDVLYADMQLVLEGDMLVKVDRMSMLHGLEVRPPFLDYEVVDFVMSLPAEYKIQPGNRKRILKDAFAGLLPKEIYTRKKQGFEVPLLKWFRNELSGMIEELLNEKFLKEQNIFNPSEVQNIRKQLQSNNPGDSAARIWGLIVFQYWWKKYIANTKGATFV